MRIRLSTRQQVRIGIQNSSIMAVPLAIKNSLNLARDWYLTVDFPSKSEVKSGISRQARRRCGNYFVDQIAVTDKHDGLNATSDRRVEHRSVQKPGPNDGNDHPPEGRSLKRGTPDGATLAMPVSVGGIDDELRLIGIETRHQWTDATFHTHAKKQQR